MDSYLTYPSIDTGLFPADYLAGRHSLLAAVSALAAVPVLTHCQHTPYPCPGQSPDGEPLHTDAFWLGSEHSAKVLVLLGGTHGVEGFVGSAVALDHLNLIAGGQLAIPPNTAILIVHALTPWGYAWLRRCDADGVDLNRNAADFSQPLPKNDGYDLLQQALFMKDAYVRQEAFANFAQQFGRAALEIAISGGQYSDPSGPFFGGDQPARGRLVTEDLIRKYGLRERDLAVVDLHSGLGPFGYGEIICDHDPSTAGVQVAHDWYGDSVTLPALGTSSSVPKAGLMDYIWHGIMNDRSCHVTLEFGSYPTDRLFEVLLRDHQLWAQQDNMPERLEHGKRMRQHFCPDDDAWKAMVLFRARQVVSQVITGLSGDGQ